MANRKFVKFKKFFRMKMVIEKCIGSFIEI